MDITPAKVKDLRERTGAGMMDCKQALQEAKGDMAAAETLLRKQDKAKASKSSGRSAQQGLVYSYIHPGSRLGVLVEVNCETDFAAASDEFNELVKDVAMHVAAADPRCIRREDVTPEVLAAERDIYRAQVLNMGKPESVVEKIVDGKMGNFYAENCLLEQPFVKDPSVTVRERIERAVGKIRENIQVRRFVRFRLGEADFTAASIRPDADA